MNCRKCGAVLLDTDTFCVKCGQRVDQLMVCSNCGEQLRDGERFCHNCGSPVESEAEDDEIPLSKQRTVDIPFDEIEQAILLEAEQAVVKRPGAGRTERRSTQGYSRPGAEETESGRQPAEGGVSWHRQSPAIESGYYGETAEDGEEMSRRPVRPTPPIRPRYEEDYDDYDEDDEEDSGDSRMKLIMIILGIIVVAIALAIGFTFWQRSHTSGYGGPGETAGQGEETDGDGDGEGGDRSSVDTKGRIQILSNVNVRNKPTTEGSEVMMVAKTGETYEYYELVDGAWYHIKLEDGREGYVSEKYVEDLQ